MDLRELPDEALLHHVTELVGSQRELTAKLVAHLGEIEARRLHLVAGFSSMFEFCTKSLRLGEGEAFRRILAARLGRRFPVVYPLLASRALNLSTLELLREWLTEENHKELFDAVANKSKLDVQAFLATRFPCPDKPSRVRRTTIEPLSESRFAIEFTASARLREKLELCRDLMSHANPSRELAVVIERAVDLLLADLEKRRLGRARRPKQTQEAREGRRSGVTNAARRAVFERDGLQCTYVADDGRRCESRAFLELDHAEPKALGGTDEARNLRVRCRAHNQLWAEQCFGRELVEGSRRFCQKKWSRRQGKPSGAEAPSTGTPVDDAPPMTTLGKLHAALRALGFREAEARRAVATVVGMNEPEALPIEQLLREAVLVATAA